MVENNANTPLTDENLPMEEAPKKETLLERLQNFRLLSIVTAGITAFGIDSLILGFFFFTVDQVYYNGPEPAKADIHYENQLVGGIFFTIMVFALIMAIATIYFALPYIKNKAKLSPNKVVGYLALITGGLLGVCAVFSFLTIALAEKPNPVFWVVSGIRFALSAALGILIFFRFLSVKLYMPKPVIKK